MKKIKKVLMTLVVLIACITIFAIIDFNRVKNNELPIFCIKKGTFMDGGSTEYIGLGYKILDYHQMLPMWVHKEVGANQEIYYDDVKIGSWFTSAGEHQEDISDFIEELINENSKSITSTNTTTSNMVNALEPNLQDAMNTTDSNGTQNIDRKLNRSPENVTIEVLEDSITNTSVKILITDNNKDTYCYEEFFAVEEKINGEWKRLDYISDDIGWIEILYSLKNNNQLDQVLDIEEYYGKLDEGIYRIVKVVQDNEKIEIYSNEFEI